MPKLTVLAIMAAASLSATVKSMMLSRSFGFTPQIELSECGYGFSPCVIAVNRFLLGKASSYDINFVISTVTTKLNQAMRIELDRLNNAAESRESAKLVVNKIKERFEDATDRLARANTDMDELRTNANSWHSIAQQHQRTIEFEQSRVQKLQTAEAGLRQQLAQNGAVMKGLEATRDENQKTMKKYRDDILRLQQQRDEENDICLKTKRQYDITIQSLSCELQDARAACLQHKRYAAAADLELANLTLLANTTSANLKRCYQELCETRSALNATRRELQAGWLKSPAARASTATAVLGLGASYLIKNMPGKPAVVPLSVTQRRPGIVSTAANVIAGGLALKVIQSATGSKAPPTTIRSVDSLANRAALPVKFDRTVVYVLLGVCGALLIALLISLAILWYRTKKFKFKYRWLLNRTGTRDPDFKTGTPLPSDADVWARVDDPNFKWK